jgi:SAM-dependent methyltransferase
MPVSGSTRTAAELLEVNRSFYDALWRDARLVTPERFNTWPLVSTLAASAPRRLEVAPGLRPRLPLDGTQFLDLSVPAVRALRGRGAAAAVGSLTALPFPDHAFDLICALDVIEHVHDDEAALAEIARVAAPGASVLMSIPLHPSRWSSFDEFVGHYHRYEPARLFERLATNGLSVERMAEYSMQPKSSRLLDIGLWFLINRRSRAMWWYNRVFMPLALRFERPLALTDGIMDTERVDEVLMVCRAG